MRSGSKCSRRKSTECSSRSTPERAGTSPLNEEKREGTFVCAACHLPLFQSDAKFESGTGWPSFFRAIPGHVETKRDFKLIWAPHRISLRPLWRASGARLQRWP